jgi:Putative beta-barrel porin-2, OmpL-like. bbp2
MRPRILSLACAMLLTVGRFGAAAQDPAPPPPVQTLPGAPSNAGGFLRQTEIIGIADGYYEYNANGLPAIEFRNFDTRDQLLSVSMMKIGVSNTPAADHRFGFRVDLHAGPATSLIHAAEPGTSRALRYVEQAYASYLAPLGTGLQVDAGVFVTQHGAEVIEAKDDWNYSRSLLFALAIPYYHMGVRATYAFNDKVSVMGAVVNGWNDVVDNNAGKTYGAQLSVKPNAKLSVVQNYMTGPEQPGNTRDWRQLSDTVVTYSATPTLSVMANYDYGRDTVAGLPVRWQGVAGYARYQWTPRLALAPRFEWYHDANGFTSGAPQTLEEMTMTGEVKLGAGFLWRAEVRRDWSNAPTFTTSSGTHIANQTTIGVGLMYAFSSK